MGTAAPFSHMSPESLPGEAPPRSLRAGVTGLPARVVSSGCFSCLPRSARDRWHSRLGQRIWPSLPQLPDVT